MSYALFIAVLLVCSFRLLRFGYLFDDSTA